MAMPTYDESVRSMLQQTISNQMNNQMNQLQNNQLNSFLGLANGGYGNSLGGQAQAGSYPFHHNDMPFPTNPIPNKIKHIGKEECMLSNIEWLNKRVDEIRVRL